MMILAVVHGNEYPSRAVMSGEYPACDASQNAILECFKFIFDANHDDVVTFEEVDQRYAAGIKGVPGPFKDAQVIKNCDIDKDGNLTMADWDSPNRTCLAYPGATNIACSVCVINGFVMTPPDYFVPPSKRSDNNGEPQYVRYTDKQLRDHAAKEHTHAEEYKKAMKENIERYDAVIERFSHLEKWKRTQLKDEIYKKHMELTEKRMANVRKRLLEIK